MLKNEEGKKSLKFYSEYQFNDKDKDLMIIYLKKIIFQLRIFGFVYVN